jgi:succinyl-diaminopimelate desuccinylase
LTQKLLAFNTINPPGNESECAHFIGNLLQEGGFDVGYHEFAENRTSLIARKMFSNDKLPICFSGHMDTVPLGLADWTRDPFGAEQAGDKVYGRGSSDMKSGLAAMIIAALRLAAMSKGSGGIVLAMTAGEETGCEGAGYLAGLDIRSNVGALIVGEPTANYPVLGHKGAFWLEAVTTGVSAHGSMPEQGVNAIYKAARAVSRLEAFDFNITAHPFLGSPTLNVGTISGGININSVPDRTTIGIDIRTLPAQSSGQILQDLQAHLGEDVALKNTIAAPAVSTDPQNVWVQEVFSLMENHIGEKPVPRGVTYFTDASALTAAFGNPPTIILGPGEADQAHKTDEYCHISKIEAVTEVYFEIARRWCRV